MEAAHMDVLRSQLVVASLTPCPGLIRLYLDHMDPLLLPRASSKNWLRLMNLVRQDNNLHTRFVLVAWDQ
ncbi:hypothetical protein P879_10707 [Paragonimus westermani]|uniref:Uncharacterized protein n=1 Tax=Paragonimus westermani TaxID=34504 RepID=A0A8T0DA42_9TREM|nr:hypothetical protein P879_10707 [Paragonimus westermani]